MAETEPATQAPPAEASTSAASPPAPAPSAAKEPSPENSVAPADNVLQPPQHWAERTLPEEDDADSTLGNDAASSTASISSSILEYRTINGRTYHSDRGTNQYWGPNDELQNETLDILHHVFTLAQDGKLFNAPIGDDCKKVLDIGTGTGIWAIDFGDAHPDAEVIGTDLSPIQSTWVPPNVHFQIDDFLQEWTFPDNSVDFVHMRWLIGCVTDWKDLFEKAYRVLKPGGWIECFEANGFFESDDDTVTKDSALAQWGMIFREGGKKLGSTASFSVVSDGVHPETMKDVGFVNVNEKIIKNPCSGWPKDPKLKEIGQYQRLAIEHDIEGIVGFSASQLGWTKEDIVMYAMHTRKELRSHKIHAYYRIGVTWAQKSLES